MEHNRIEFDYSKLVGRIVEKFGTRSAFAEAAGMADSVVSYRLNNKTRWTMDEIARIILPDCLDIATEEIGVYFYTPKVR